jgi:hypothetical protein
LLRNWRITLGRGYGSGDWIDVLPPLFHHHLVKLAEVILVFVTIVVAVWFAMETFPEFVLWRERIARTPSLPEGSDGPVIDI